MLLNNQSSWGAWVRVSDALLLLPHGALLLWVHGRSPRALEVPGELLAVGHDPVYPELSRGVGVGDDLLLEGGILPHGAPGLGPAHPEQLLGPQANTG